MAVYFIQCLATTMVKIGVATDPARRLAALQTGAPGELVLVGSIEGDVAEEGRLHAQFSEYRERGEWFRFDGALREYLGRFPAVPLNGKMKAPLPPDPRGGWVGAAALRIDSRNGRRSAERQGYVLARDDIGLLIEQFSWLDGRPTYAVLVPWREIIGDERSSWAFFPTVPDMNDYVERWHLADPRGEEEPYPAPVSLPSAS